MPQITIPALGSVIELEQDWEFKLYDEHRNEKLQITANLFPPFRLSGGMQIWRDMTDEQRQFEIAKSGWHFEPPAGWEERDHKFWNGDWSTNFILRAGTRLKFDRIYIRQGQGDFDSVTFRSDCWMSNLGDPLFTRKYINGRKVKSIRFWAKLSDVNQIVGKFITN